MRKSTKLNLCKSLVLVVALLLCSTLLFTSCKKNKDEPAPKDEVDPGVTAGDLGKVRFTYRGKQVTYTSVRAKDGNIWLQQNMGALKVAASRTDSEAYGDFFQWGRWDDGHQVRDPAPAMGGELQVNNPSGIKNSANSSYFTNWWFNGKTSDQWTAQTPEEATATNGCDPCKALGDSWRLPTDSEWGVLVSAEGIKDSETAFLSTLKIPEAGWRSNSNSSSLVGVASQSWFWSSTTAGDRGRGLWILSGSISVSYPDARGYGTSMRCIKK